MCDYFSEFIMKVVLIVYLPLYTQQNSFREVKYHGKEWIKFIKFSKIGMKLSSLTLKTLENERNVIRF
jgi:hypothetical protein